MISEKFQQFREADTVWSCLIASLAPLCNWNWSGGLQRWSKWMTGRLIWGFPESRVPPKSSIFRLGLSLHHPAIGVSHLWKPHILPYILYWHVLTHSSPSGRLRASATRHQLLWWVFSALQAESSENLRTKAPNQRRTRFYLEVTHGWGNSSGLEGGDR